MPELDPLPDDLRRLLDAEKRREEAPEEARARVLLRLGGTFALGASIAHTGGTTSPGAPVPPAAGATALGRAARVGGAVRLARAAAIFAAGAASGVGGQRAVQHLRAKPAAHAARPAPALPPVPTPAPEERPAAQTPPPAAASEPPALRAHRLAAVPSVAPPAAPGEGDDRLAAERAPLEIARAALARGDAEGALAALDRHEAKFPRGELTEEREGLCVQALVAAGRYDQARARAARFVHRYPHSLFSPVVMQALESIP